MFGKWMLAAGFAACCMMATAPVRAADAPLLADRHVARLGGCQGCHKEMPPKAVGMKQCLACHVSYEKLAERTDKKDINPHASHVEDAECTQCHRGHKKPVLLCDECHEFTSIKVP